MSGKVGRRKPPKSEVLAAATPAGGAKSGRFDNVPAWLQGIAALAGVVLTAAGLFGIAGLNSAPGASPSAASQAPPMPLVTLDSVTTDANQVIGAGSYVGLHPDRNAVLFIGQPSEGDAQWLPVVAVLTATSTADDGTQRGEWEAIRPAVAGRYTWYAVMGPRQSGADDPYADLRARGPDSEIIDAASEPVTTED